MDIEAHTFIVGTIVLFFLINFVSLMVPLVCVPFRPGISRSSVTRQEHQKPLPSDVPTLLASISVAGITSSTSPSRVDVGPTGGHLLESSAATSSPRMEEKKRIEPQ